MARGTQFVNTSLGDLLDQLDKAAEQNLPDNVALMVNGKKLNKKQLRAELATHRQKYDAAKAAKDALSLRVQERDAADPQAYDFVTGYIAALQGAYGPGLEVKKKFGIPVERTTRKLSVEEKMARNSKAAATRTLRNTMGSRQKMGIKATGNFAVTVTPPGAAQPVASPPAAQPVAAPQPVTITPPASSASPAPVVSQPAPAPVSQPAPVTAPPAATPALPQPPAPGVAGSGSNGTAAPMLMNGSDH